MLDEARGHLYEALHALEHRAVTARKRAEELCSRREAARTAYRPPYNTRVDSRRISSWVPRDRCAAQVPSARDGHKVLALVRVWSAWAGDQAPDLRYWTNLIDAAQPGRGRKTVAGDGPSAHLVPGPRPNDLSGRVVHLGVQTDVPQWLGTRSAPGLGFASDRGLPLATGIALTPLVVPQRRVAGDRLRGREDLVAGLVDAIQRRVAGRGEETPGVWVLCGLGGCGKTTVALEVAHRLSGVVRTWWVSVTDDEGPASALHAVAFDTGAKSGEFGLLNPADVLWRRLNALTEPWLLVLDNVDDPTLLAVKPHRLADGVGWLRVPSHRWGTVVVTSRESREERWGAWVHLQPVDLLNVDDGAQILRDLAPAAGGEGEARELAEHLGGLPLALDLAGSYLAAAARDVLPDPQMPETFADYRRVLDKRLGDLAVDQDSSLSEWEKARRSLKTTWELSLDLLHRQGHDLARPLLRLLSCFGAAPIPHQALLNPDLLAVSPFFPNPTHRRIQHALQGLAGLRLINVETDATADQDIQRRVDIHPLVRASNREHVAAHAVEYLGLLIALLDRTIGVLEPGNPAHWPRWHAFAPHCTASLRLLLAGNETRPEVVVAATAPTLRAAQYRNSVGLYADAVTELRTIVSVREGRLGAHDTAVFESRLSLAWALRDDGQLDEAESEYRALSDACQRILPADHPHLLSARGGLARVLRARGRYKDAETELQAVLQARQRNPEGNLRDILRTRHDLATVWYRLKLLADAVTELREVWEANRSRFGEIDPDSLASGTNLARALRDTGETEEAERVCMKVLDGCRNALGSEHPKLLVARHELARIARDRGQLEKAEVEFSEIWKINERRFGAEHPDTRASRHELATVLHLRGELGAAEAHFRELLDVNQRRLGEDHPDTRTCRHNLELVLEKSTRPSAGQGPPNLHREENTVMDQAPQTYHVTGILDMSGLALDEALSLDHSDLDLSVQKLLRRIERPRVSRGYDEDGGGYSWGSDTPDISYQPPSQPRTGDSAPDLAAELVGEPDHGDDPKSRPRHVLRPEALRAIAMGREDCALIEELWAEQRSSRIRLLVEILKETNSRQDAVGPLLPIEMARGLLIEAADVDPSEVDAVLLYPHVGRWMGHILRRLWGKTVDPAVPLWVDVGYLHAIAAAAGIRAGLSFTCRIPVREGVAVLPTLGFADLRSPELGVADLVVDTGVATIQTSQAKVQLPTMSVPASAGWHELREIKARSGSTSFAVWLDDVDPYRDFFPPSRPSPLPAAQARRWQSLIEDAWHVLVQLDVERATALSAAVTVITPRPKLEGARLMTASSSDAFGAAVLSEPEDSVQLAAALDHEFRHMKLESVLNMVELYDDHDDGKLFYAPWRDDPRPFAGLFQGVYAFFGVADFWRKRIHQATGTAQRHAQFELAYWRTQVWDVFNVLRSSPRFTSAGHQFLAMMAESASEWRAEPVPADVASLAVEAVIDHRARWRIHHVRPEPATVSELANAWIAGRGNPLRGVTTSALQPDPAARLLDTSTALLRLAAISPTKLRNTDPAPHEQGQSAAKSMAADMARILGDTDLAKRMCVQQLLTDPLQFDPWISLGLALRRTDPSPAARTLLLTPELVRATYDVISRKSGTAPTPWALAAWIGAPDGQDLPPIYSPL